MAHALTTPQAQKCIDDAKAGSMIAKVAYTAATDGADDWPEAIRAVALETYGLEVKRPEQFDGVTFA